MRTTNPILSRADAFTPGYPGATYAPNQGYAQAPYGPQTPYAGQPPYGAQAPYGGQPPYGMPGAAYAPQQPAGRMTIDDVITKTATLMLVLVAAAGLTWLLLPLQLMLPVVIIGSLVTVVTVWMVALRRELPVAGVFVYAAVEGVVLGAFSKLFEYLYPGIVLQAVVGTVISAFVVLGAYRYLNVRVRGRFAQIVTVSIIAYAVFALLSLVLSMFGVSTGAFAIGGSAGPLAWLMAGIGVVLSAASLLMDFDAIENGVRIGAPEKESWRGAFGLITSLVWMYTELLRILSFFRN